jgi:hypothetical protein
MILDAQIATKMRTRGVHPIGLGVDVALIAQCALPMHRLRGQGCNEIALIQKLDSSNRPIRKIHGKERVLRLRPEQPKLSYRLTI